MIEFRVYGNPVPQGRPRLTTINGHAHAYDPAKSRDWKRTVHSIASEVVAKNSARFPLQGPLSVTLRFYMPRPKSLPKRVTHHTKRPDCDNLGKACLDAMQGCLYRDDAQVWNLNVVKAYADAPGVAIEIQEGEK